MENERRALGYLTLSVKVTHLDCTGLKKAKGFVFSSQTTCMELFNNNNNNNNNTLRRLSLLISASFVEIVKE